MSGTRRHEFARKLGELRHQRGLTQRAVAGQLAAHGHEIAVQTISGWERGSFSPDIEKARALDLILGADGSLLRTLGYAARTPAVHSEPVVGLSPAAEELLQPPVDTRSLRERVDALSAQLVTERRERLRLEARVEGCLDVLADAEVDYVASEPVELRRSWWKITQGQRLKAMAVSAPAASQVGS